MRNYKSLPLSISVIVLGILLLLYLFSDNIILIILLIIDSIIVVLSAISIIVGDIKNKNNITPKTNDTTITFNDNISTLIITKDNVTTNIKYDDIIDYEILLDNDVVFNPSFKGAAIGKELHGFNGMILGSLIAGNENEYINSLNVCIKLINNSSYIIPMISKRILKDSKEYREKANTLDWLINKLNEIKA